MYHQSTGTTPLEALYGRPPSLLINYFSANSLFSEVDKTLRNKDEVLKALKQNLHKANNRMKQYEDAHRREEHFQLGDWVYVMLPPYR